MIREDSSAKSANRNLLRGSAWAVLLRWAGRGIGLVSILILARLLSPEDLGLFAIAMIVIGLMDHVSDMGVTTHLIRVKEATVEHCNTAWTVSILQALVVAAGTLLIAPAAAAYFNEPRVVPMLSILALSALVLGFTNVGMTLVRRNLDFATDFRFELYRRLVRFVSTIALAWILRNYWALVIGQVITAVATVALSYGMHRYRPRISFVELREYLIFGAHMLPIRLTRYLSGRTGLLVVGRFASTPVAGVFNVVAELANLIIQEFVVPIGRALLPSYAKAAGNPAELARAWLDMYAFTCAICLASGAGLALVAEDAILVLLGEKWRAGIDYLPWLSAFATLKGVAFVMNGPILIVSRNERTALVSSVVESALLLPFAFGAAYLHGVSAVPVGMVLAELLFLPISAAMLMRALPISAMDLVRETWRPALAALVMIGVLQVSTVAASQAPIVRLTVDIALGSVAYAGTTLVLWLVSGRPAGPEAVVLALLSRRRRPGV